jgi:Ion channel
MAMERWLPWWEILFGAAGLVLSLLFHGFGMAYVQKKNRDYQRLAPFRFRRQVTFSLLIFLLLCTHLVEVLLWAAALVFIGAVPVIRDAFYYAAVTYTTLGYNESTLSHEWRIIAPMMAMSGVFAFGWTTSVLFAIVSSYDDAQRNTEGA